MTANLIITGAKVYDPAHDIDGDVRDIYIKDGRVVSDKPADARTVNATGCVAMPGGVDIHCHIASTAINRARAILGEEAPTHVHRCLTPSTDNTGKRYAALGYTTAVEAAVAPSAARHTHMQLADTPNLDAGFLLLLANHQCVIDLLSRGDDDAAVSFIAHQLRATGAYGIKVVNPGGVAAWRHDAKQHIIETLDDNIANTAVTPRRILQCIATAAEKLNLPHAPHVHCNRLGLPGNVDTTLATIDAMENRRVHLTHLQFHAYGTSGGGDFTSAATQLIDRINNSPNVTADVGQVVFGDAVTLTADTPLEYTLWQLTGKRYASVEAELETGCGVMPIRYSDKQYLHSLQWSIGLELMLACDDPWRMLLSTDHPNGGSFLSYPAIIAGLMSKTVRDEQMKKANPRAMKHSPLRDLTREMTLGDIAVITRAGPARVLGLEHKGHLGPGADGDVTIYHDLAADPQRMFESPRYVIKAGRVLVDDGDLQDAAPGRRFAAPIEPNEKGAQITHDWLADHGSYHPSQFEITPDP